MNDKDVVARGFEFVEVETDGFIEAATNAIAADGGFVDFFGDNNGEAGFTAVVVAKNEGEIGATNRLAVPVNRFNSSAGMKTVFVA